MKISMKYSYIDRTRQICLEFLQILRYIKRMFAVNKVLKDCSKNSTQYLNIYTFKC